VFNCHDLIRIRADSMMSCPFGTPGIGAAAGRIALVRLIQCEVVRAGPKASRLKDQLGDAAFSGTSVRHGVHPVCVAAILENGEVAGSRGSGHAYTVPGVYTCEEHELTLLDYGTRGIIGSGRAGRPHQSLWNEYGPAVQFIFRGRETAEGAQKVVTRSMGSDQQRIYTKDDMVVWDELQVWTGVPIQVSDCIGVYHSAVYDDGSRRPTRLIKVSPFEEHYRGYV